MTPIRWCRFCGTPYRVESSPDDLGGDICTCYPFSYGTEALKLLGALYARGFKLDRRKTSDLELLRKITSLVKSLELQQIILREKAAR